MSQAISDLPDSIALDRAAATAAPAQSTTTARPRVAHPTHLAAAIGRPIIWVLRRYWGVIALVLGWHLYVTLLDINRIVMPSPGSVATELATNPGRYVEPTMSSMSVALIGLLGGTTVGIVFASLS